MDWLQWLTSWDARVFEAINQGLANDFFDILLTFWRNKYSWIPAYVLLLLFWIIRYRWRTWFLAAFLLAAVAIGDTVSSQWIKKSVQRLRPCNDIEQPVRVVIPCGPGYSFTSSHATNHFAIAVFVWLTVRRRFRGWGLPLLFWASLVALAQVYVGVHYPLDVLAGALLGSFIGWLCAEGCRRLRYQVSAYPEGGPTRFNERTKSN